MALSHCWHGLCCFSLSSFLPLEYKRLFTAVMEGLTPSPHRVPIIQSMLGSVCTSGARNHPKPLIFHLRFFITRPHDLQPFCKDHLRQSLTKCKIWTIKEEKYFGAEYRDWELVELNENGRRFQFWFWLEGLIKQRSWSWGKTLWIYLFLEPRWKWPKLKWRILQYLV